MSLTDYQLKEFSVSLSALPDRITGRAAWLKQQFDARGDELKDALNLALEALGGKGGAALVGAEDASGQETTVQKHLFSTENPHAVTAAQVGAYTKAETERRIAESIAAALKA